MIFIRLYSLTGKTFRKQNRQCGRGRYGLLGEYSTRTVSAIVDTARWGLPEKRLCFYPTDTFAHVRYEN